MLTTFFDLTASFELAVNIGDEAGARNGDGAGARSGDVAGVGNGVENARVHREI